MDFYRSYTLLLKPPILMRSCLHIYIPACSVAIAGTRHLGIASSVETGESEAYYSLV